MIFKKVWINQKRNWLHLFFSISSDIRWSWKKTELLVWTCQFLFSTFSDIFYEAETGLDLVSTVQLLFRHHSDARFGCSAMIQSPIFPLDWIQHWFSLIQLNSDKLQTFCFMPVSYSIMTPAVKWPAGRFTAIVKWPAL